MEDLIKRLRQIAKAIADQDMNELSMRVPAEPDRDADLVVMRSANLIEQQAAEIAMLREIQKAAQNLVDQNGRHHTQIAYERLVEALAGKEPK